MWNSLDILFRHLTAVGYGVKEHVVLSVARWRMELRHLIRALLVCLIM
jgi:hypothetical protein